MKVRSTQYFDFENVENILVRGTNWIGDVIMTLPAVAALRETFPHARISILAKPWVADIYRICTDVDEVIVFQSPGIHQGIAGKYRLAGELKKEGFDTAILLQNAIEAAIIAWLARIPVRAGYNSDGRGLLLTHSVKRTAAIREVHQIFYYLEMLRSLGFRIPGTDIHLALSNDDIADAQSILESNGVRDGEMIIGIAPGATYGPAKMWFPERYAAVADRLAEEFSASVILFGSGEDRRQANLVQQYGRNKFINLAGDTTLREAVTLISCCNLFISNDSGLMHLAGALDIPLAAIFGSTNPVTTSPVGKKSVVIHKEISCSPCLKKICPTDFRCMDLIEVDDVYAAARNLMVCEIGSNTDGL